MASQRVASIVSSNKKNPGINLIYSSVDSLTGNLKGIILDELHKAQQFSTVSLLNAADSSIVVNVLSDTSGIYRFNLIKPGNYLIKANMMGYSVVYSSHFKIAGGELLTLEPLTMAPLSNNLKEIGITASRAVVERKNDRFIVNVENSAMTSGNSIQLLKTFPFVTASTSAGVSLQGKKTLVLIDNKPVPDGVILNILEALPAGSIVKIELITNPSAKYDGAYGAVINIITKKAQINGLVGEIRTLGSMGKFGEYNVNSGLTYKHEKLTLFGTGSFTESQWNLIANQNRIFNNSEIPDVLEDNAIRKINHKDYSLQLGANLDLAPNQSIGAVVNASSNPYSGDVLSKDIFSKLNSKVDSILATNSNAKYTSTTYNYNLNYHLTTDSGKNDLSVLTTFTPFQGKLNQLFPSVLLTPEGEILKIPPVYKTLNSSLIKIYIAQLDYKHSFRDAWKLESGLKYQNTNSRTGIDYNLDNGSGQFENVPKYSSDNKLSEAISSGYFMLIKDWKDDMIQFGTRIENTNAKGTGIISQNYTQFFPSALFNHNFSKDYNISINYKRTINRAPYDELAPYTIFINQYTVFAGNPLLKPQYDNVFTINSTLKKLSVSATYDSGKNSFAQLPLNQAENTRVTYYNLANLTSSKNLHFDLFYPLRLTSWWNTQNSGTVFGYLKATGIVQDQPFSRSSAYFNLKTNHTIKFTKDIRMELYAYYNSSYVSDLTRNGNYGNIDIAFLLTVLSGKGEIRFGGEELLKRNVYVTEQDFDSYQSKKYNYVDSRRAFVGFTYKFGKTKIVTPDKKLGNEDAVGRIK